MSRGSSLSIDLQLLVNNPKYSDIIIICAKSEKLYGCRAILAARSEVFDRLLFNERKETDEREIKFPEINSQVDILPELLTKAVGNVIPNSDQPLPNLLARYVTKIPLVTIPYESLSSPAFQFLLMYCTMKKKSMAKNPYTIFRYVALHAANQVEQEIPGDVVTKIESCLPPLEEILEQEHAITKDTEGLSSFRTKMTEKLTPMLNYVNIKLISGGILTGIIEPLNIVPFQLILEAYRYKVKAMREIDFTWDPKVCGPHLAPYYLSSNERVRASQSITGSGVCEWDIIIENPSSSDWVGICGEGEVTNYNCTDYNSKAWILGTTGMVSNNGQSINYGSPSFQQGTKIRVHLDMGKRERRVSFSINDVKYPEVLHWKNIPAKVYPLVSLRYPGRLKIQKKD
ncbi:11612_t:CDS:2 [Diversispora eburnea]|uniref:11612_t:CDS:1 n=1 Tax=Diversispora eburnea TaxID=1213867 RepID=A0A9N9BRE5_9GLOM|nr:11612_t:CDS:2 [Diversispora eburnea]